VVGLLQIDYLIFFWNNSFKGTKGSEWRAINGLKDIQEYLLTTNYNRLRFGVGFGFWKGKQIDYCLGEWNERKRMPW